MTSPLEQLKNNFMTLAHQWDQDIIPVLKQYIEIPNKSPHFDTAWKQHGYMDQAMALIQAWCEKQPIKNMTLEVLELENRTPLLFIDIPGHSAETVLLYGHMDKQPEMEGWDENKGPWKAVQEGDLLYGRGGADDGYSTFASLSAIAYLQKLNIPHARCVVMIEGCEESGSYDLPFYISHLKERIGTPNLVICLDSGCGNYKQLWQTTSLRGLAGGTLTVKVLTEGIHSGSGSGIVPNPMMIMRDLLARLEDKKTGKIIVDELHVEIPQLRIEQAEQTAPLLKEELNDAIPFVKGAHSVVADTKELLLNRTWRPALSVTGVEGLPTLANAGNVTVPYLSLKLSMRLPPTCDAKKASHAIQQIVEQDPPFGAQVTYQPDQSANGWEAPPLSEWLVDAVNHSSHLFFDRPSAYFGEGGTIPFMSMLGRLFPQAEFLITGVLGPRSNAHGPNEFLHISMAKKLTGCVAAVIAQHFIHYDSHK
ncbi:MAG TPA: M20 family metallopeptidase [Coxiellaceae bacterium]|nr:M20 family metallopeptidase [Coxiellaceae bacterium]